MKLYHGSITEIKNPSSDFGRKKLDFGQGFYLTTLSNQAEDWAIRKANDEIKLGNNAVPVVSVYEFIDSDRLYHKRFTEYNEEWLMFVVNNRRSDFPVLKHGYDVIFGSIADDKVAQEVDRFIELLKQEKVSDVIIKATLQELSFQTKNDQYCFATQKAVECLNFVESYEVQNER